MGEFHRGAIARVEESMAFGPREYVRGTETATRGEKRQVSQGADRGTFPGRKGGTERAVACGFAESLGEYAKEDKMPEGTPL